MQTDFSAIYITLSDVDFIHLFRFIKEDIRKEVHALELYTEPWKSNRSRYQIDGLLTACIIPRFMAVTAS